MSSLDLLPLPLSTSRASSFSPSRRILNPSAPDQLQTVRERERKSFPSFSPARSDLRCFASHVVGDLTSGLFVGAYRSVPAREKRCITEVFFGFWCVFCWVLKSLASSVTPTKAYPAAEQEETPRSVKNNVCDGDKAFASNADAPGSSSTKTRKSGTKKRFRPFPDKNVAKKLFSGKEPRDDNCNTDGVSSDQISPIKDA